MVSPSQLEIIYALQLIGTVKENISQLLNQPYYKHPHTVCDIQYI